MAAHEEGNDRRIITYFRRRFRHQPLPLTPPRTPEIIPHKPRMIDDDSEEDMEREDKFYLEEKEVDKKVHEEESENMFEKTEVWRKQYMIYVKGLKYHSYPYNLADKNKPKMIEDASEKEEKEEKDNLEKKKLTRRQKKVDA
ncbi:hypothetical protein GLYMA_15G226300v4 [Glycine max]|nr:hypothetical protein GLYMA_15G226300v4 [Glycine max]KAH1148454.1 hypothetical protein GYH30_043193 [Glycine max]KAH1210472.1 hypothetical protein GmHk_15G044772 [Glycine max]|eukprot:XP_006598064.1 uncharacterized protein LOC102669872 isoform X1 [Glycine max]